MINSNNQQSMTNEDIEAQSRQDLDSYVRDKKIFIDTCSLLDESANLFWANIKPILQKYNRHIIVPFRVTEEIEKHADSTDVNLRHSAKSAICNLNNLIKDDCVEFYGDCSDNFADNVFLTEFTRLRLKYELLLITQDRNLSYDILRLNNNKADSRDAKQVLVKRINRFGFLSKPNPPEDEPASNTCYTKTQAAAAFNPFSYTNVTNIPATEIPVSYVPTSEDKVYYGSTGKILVLKKAISSGGEGKIYETNTQYIAKIYNKITKRKYEKLQLLFRKNLSYSGICFPKEPLYNDRNEFVGFLMNPAKGKELRRSVFMKPLMFQYFPDWKKKDTVQLSITILKAIRYLHNNGIIIGDINPSNILVESPLSVWFVDADSFQVDDFPCPVGTVPFTPPELQNNQKKYSEYLRTVGNENFAIATLLFMIMLPGKTPYSQQGGEDQATNIVKMDFSYPLGENSNKKTPDGPWRFMWSHLSYKIKDAFYNTFRAEGKYSTERTRLSVNDWLSLFEEYYELLTSGKLGMQDKMSEELFPTRFKLNKDTPRIICRLCGNEWAEEFSSDGICQNCLNIGETYQCEKCGKDLVYTNYRRYIEGKRRLPYCPDCYSYIQSNNNEVFSYQTCVQCGKTFSITQGEESFYRSKGLDLPKRCEYCREHRFDSSANNQCSSNSPRTQGAFGVGSQKGSAKPEKRSLCFITTAVCQYQCKPDNCFELETLRDFRDSWLFNQIDGKQLISEYYEIAPEIVNLINDSQFSSFYYDAIWEYYIVPCIEMIIRSEFTACKGKYVEMINWLKKEFLKEEP